MVTLTFISLYFPLVVGAVEMPKTGGSKKVEFRVYLDKPIADEVKRTVSDKNTIYSSPSEFLRDIIREWYKKKKEAEP